jgi:hypothetical protein
MTVQVEKTSQSPYFIYATKRDAQKKLVEELKVEWKAMWSERYNDKVVAEGISVAEYERLRVDQGTVINATRSFKALNFKDILTEHMVENADRYIQPNSSEGGWNKFIKTQITNTSMPKRKRADSYVPVKPKGSQPKKGGRGWLHAT